jgi:PAS domain S-box-containing protein
MYLRTYKRKNKNGSVAEYYQLAYNERDPETKQPVARIVHNFGRADRRVRDELLRLCKSIARVCNFEFIDSLGEPEEELGQKLRPHREKGRATRQISEELQSSEEKFRTIFENARDMIAFVDLEGKIVEINPIVEKLFGVRREDAIGKYFYEIENLSPETLQESLESFKDAAEGDPPTRIEGKAFHRDGSVVFIEVTIRLRKKGSAIGYFCVIRDITKRKLAEESLERHRDRLEELVKERTANLEEANTALRVLLRQKDEHKAELEERVIANVNELILPNLEKLKTVRMGDHDKKVLDIVENNLRDIISSFGQKLSSKYFNLTTTELRIANLIKYGNTTKEIAKLSHLSPRTIEFHRNNIRKKIGINNKRVNLKSYLLSLL